MCDAVAQLKLAVARCLKLIGAVYRLLRLLGHLGQRVLAALEQALAEGSLEVDVVLELAVLASQLFGHVHASVQQRPQMLILVT